MYLNEEQKIHFIFNSIISFAIQIRKRNQCAKIQKNVFVLWTKWSHALGRGMQYFSVIQNLISIISNGAKFHGTIFLLSKNQM